MSTTHEMPRFSRPIGDSVSNKHATAPRKPSRALGSPSTGLSEVGTSVQGRAAATASTAPTSVGPSDVDERPPIDVRFATVPSLLAALEAVSADPGVDSLAVGGVAPSDFAAMDRAVQTRGHKWRLFYLAEHGMLIVTLPNQPHERLHRRLYETIQNQIAAMGLSEAWDTCGATRFPAQPAAGASQGEGDSEGKPMPGRFEETAWPTIVVEAGFSQSLASLRAKMRFWFARSQHDVKVVLLAKAFPADGAQKRICIEQWQERPTTMAAARPGAMTTRLAALSAAAPGLQPVCVQTINIVWAVPGVRFDDATRDKQRNRQSFNVVRGPLRLEFAQLFLRQPHAPREHNIEVPDNALQYYATTVWGR